MRYASLRHGDRRFAAIVEEDHVVPLEGVAELGRMTPSLLLADPPRRSGQSPAIEDVQFLPVVPSPGKIVCVGLNYDDHIKETGRELPAYPVLFAKFSDSLVGAYDPIILAPESHQIDYEAELAIIIGSDARRVTADRALQAVAGYTVANDVTMRDYQYKTHQWLQGKAWDNSTPLGPALVTVDEVGDGSGLDVEMRLNGEVMQAGNTAQLIFDVPTLVSVVSEFTTLHPGDVILTGTPGGVGYRRDPQVFLTEGDSVVVEISGIGRTDNLATVRSDRSGQLRAHLLENTGSSRDRARVARATSPVTRRRRSPVQTVAAPVAPRSARGC